MTLPGLIGLTGVRGLGRRAAGGGRQPETLALMAGETDWPEPELAALDTFWKTTRAALGTSYIVWFYPDFLDLARGIRALRSNAGALSVVAPTNNGPFLLADLSDGLKGNGSTKFLGTTLTQADVGITASSGFCLMYGNKEQPAGSDGAYGGTFGGNATHLARFATSGNAIRVSSTVFVADIVGSAVPAFFGASRYDASNIRRLLDSTASTAALAGLAPTTEVISSHARTGNAATLERMKFLALGGRAMSAADLVTMRDAVIALQVAWGRPTL